MKLETCPLCRGEGSVPEQGNDLTIAYMAGFRAGKEHVQSIKASDKQKRITELEAENKRLRMVVERIKRTAEVMLIGPIKQDDCQYIHTLSIQALKEA